MALLGFASPCAKSHCVIPMMFCVLASHHYIKLYYITSSSKGICCTLQPLHSNKFLEIRNSFTIIPNENFIDSSEHTILILDDTNTATDSVYPKGKSFYFWSQRHGHQHKHSHEHPSPQLSYHPPQKARHLASFSKCPHQSVKRVSKRRNISCIILHITRDTPPPYPKQAQINHVGFKHMLKSFLVWKSTVSKSRTARLCTHIQNTFLL